MSGRRHTPETTDWSAPPTWWHVPGSLFFHRGRKSASQRSWCRSASISVPPPQSGPPSHPYGYAPEHGHRRIPLRYRPSRVLLPLRLLNLPQTLPEHPLQSRKRWSAPHTGNFCGHRLKALKEVLSLPPVHHRPQRIHGWHTVRNNRGIRPDPSWSLLLSALGIFSPGTCCRRCTGYGHSPQSPG